MDPDTVLAVIAGLATSVVCLGGLWMFLNYRIKRLQVQGGGQRPRELDEGLAEIKEQMYLLRGELSDLHERVDFTERVLARGRDGAKLTDGN